MGWLRTPSRVIPDLIRDPRTRLAKVLRLRRFWVPVFAGMTVLAGIITAPLLAAEIEKAVERDYSLVRAEPAPRTQEWDMADAKSAGCVSCNTASDAQTMHKSTAVVLGCTDCPGGHPSIVTHDVSDHDAPLYDNSEHRRVGQES